MLVWEGPVKDLGPKTYADREKDATAFLGVYTDWCNGACYWFRITEEVTLPCGHTEIKDDDCSIGGFIGDDGLAEAIACELGGEKARFIGEAAWLADYGDLSDLKLKEAR